MYPAIASPKPHSSSYMFVEHKNYQQFLLLCVIRLTMLLARKIGCAQEFVTWSVQIWILIQWIKIPMQVGWVVGGLVWVGFFFALHVSQHLFVKLSAIALFIVASKLVEIKASEAFREKCMVFSPSIASQSGSNPAQQ